MTYQTIYSSEATTPMQTEDLEELLQRARRRNAIEGISGALVYTDGIFLQILEGERAKVHALMARIHKDVRHENVTVLREGDVPAPLFSSWKMAYVSATPAEVARWAGIDVVTGKSEAVDDHENVERTAQFAQDILALLAREKSGGEASRPDLEPESGVP